MNMAKIYNFERYKLRKELRELELFLEQKYALSREFKMIWFDHYSVTATQRRISEIKEKLKELDNVCDTPKK